MGDGWLWFWILAGLCAGLLVRCLIDTRKGRLDGRK